MRVRTTLKRDEIVSSAAEVFREMGFERASMSEIAARVGGSKATLYGYFTSKEELFLAVTHAESTAYFNPVMEELCNADEDMPKALCQFGERAVAYILRPEALAVRRMVLGAAGQSQIAHAFFTHGPKKGLDFLESYFLQSIKDRRLRLGDARVMAQQLIALLEAELMPERLYGIEKDPPTTAVISAAVKRAVDVFLAAYMRCN